MKNRLLAALFLSLNFFLCACGPVYETRYEYKPPASSGGKTCVVQCQQNKMLCEQLRDSQKNECESRKRSEALFLYTAYKSERESKGLPLEKNLRDFEGFSNCTSSRNCDEDFRTCYATCGGSVVPHTTCVYNCEKA